MLQWRLKKELTIKEGDTTIQLNLGARWRSTDALAHAGLVIAATDFSFLIIVLPKLVSFPSGNVTTVNQMRTSGTVCAERFRARLRGRAISEVL